MTRASLTLLLVCAAPTLACSKTPEPTPEPARESPPAATTAATPAPASTASALAEIGWEAPSAWQSMPNPNAMRKATYKIPRAAGDAEDAELTVSAAAGGVDANVKRWAGQFGDATPKTEKKQVNGLDVTVVEIRGTFAGGGPMMGAPQTSKEKQMLLGAVVDAGDRQHFFKLTGPEKTVTAARSDFDKLVASFRSK
jgi:hypothetical protein